MVSTDSFVFGGGIMVTEMFLIIILNADIQQLFYMGIAILKYQNKLFVYLKTSLSKRLSINVII